MNTFSLYERKFSDKFDRRIADFDTIGECTRHAAKLIAHAGGRLRSVFTVQTDEIHSGALKAVMTDADRSPNSWVYLGEYRHLNNQEVAQ